MKIVFTRGRRGEKSALGRTARVAVLAAVVALALTATAFAKTHWRVVEKRTERGGSVTASVGITINHPKKIAVKLVHGTGSASWICTKGEKTTSYSRFYGAGFHVLSHVSGQTSCQVSASIIGQKYVTVEILIS